MLLSTATENTSDAITDAAYALTDSYDTTAVQADKPYTLDLTTVPEIVGTDTAVDAGHVQRLYEQEEDLYSVVFRNDDGTKTAYYYNHPVKYVDTDGSIKDITLEIEASETVSGAYESKDTVAQTVFSQKMTDGITLNGENVSIRLAPLFSDTSAEITPVTPGASVSSVSARTGTDSLIASPSAQLKDGKSVVYQYDSKTSYEYALTYTGFKEDIL